MHLHLANFMLTPPYSLVNVGSNGIIQFNSCEDKTERKKYYEIICFSGCIDNMIIRMLNAECECRYSLLDVIIISCILPLGVGERILQWCQVLTWKFITSTKTTRFCFWQARGCSRQIDFIEIKRKCIPYSSIAAQYTCYIHLEKSSIKRWLNQSLREEFIRLRLSAEP